MVRQYGPAIRDDPDAGDHLSRNLGDKASVGADQPVRAANSSAAFRRFAGRSHQWTHGSGEYSSYRHHPTYDIGLAGLEWRSGILAPHHLCAIGGGHIVIFRAHARRHADAGHANRRAKCCDDGAHHAICRPAHRLFAGRACRADCRAVGIARNASCGDGFRAGVCARPAVNATQSAHARA